jgi:hypothetical protein
MTVVGSMSSNLVEHYEYAVDWDQGSQIGRTEKLPAEPGYRLRALSHVA